MESNDDLVELARFPNEPLAAALVARLGDEGIRAAIFGGHIKNSDLYFALTLSIAVMVRRDDLERARTLLGAGALPEGWEDEAERMPREDDDWDADVGDGVDAREDSGEDSGEDFDWPAPPRR